MPGSPILSAGFFESFHTREENYSDQIEAIITLRALFGLPELPLELVETGMIDSPHSI
jgi:hypothetical protein